MFFTVSDTPSISKVLNRVLRVFESSALRWPKFFAISLKSKVEGQKFLTVKNHPKISRLISTFDFRESLNETNEIIKSFVENVKNVQEFLTLDGMC